MSEHIKMLGRELNPGFCSVDVYKELLAAFKEHDVAKIENILANSEVDPDYRYGDPEYGTLLDLCTMAVNYSDVIHQLLLHDANPNIINAVRKKGPIHFASQNSDVNSLRVLVECPKTDLNLLDSTGSTALHYVVRQDDPEVIAVKLLIDHNADLNLMNRKGKTPLHIALEYDNREAVMALLKGGADLSIVGPDGTTLEDDLIATYPDIDSSNQNAEKIYRSDMTHGQLFGLLRNHRFDEFLQGVKVNKHLLEQNDGCHTFLQYCCEFGYPKVVDALLDIGACPNTSNAALRQTPLMLAARRGHAEIITILLRHQDAIDCSPVDGETPLHCVVNGSQSPLQTDADYLECLNILLTQVPKSQLNINHQDFKANTVLHYAAKLRQHNIVLKLLQHGAYIGLENIMGEAACADIAYSVFLEHLDSCVGTNDAMPREDNYEITFDYNFLLPIKCNTLNSTQSTNGYDPENNTHHNRYLQSETMPLLHIARNRELRPLLKHPIFTSFLHLKWHRIRHYFYINLCFYLLFWAFLTVYILQIYGSSDKVNPEIGNSTTVSEATIDQSFNPTWLIVTLLLGVLFLRELFQLFIAPIKYLLSPENWLEIAIIIITCIILFCKSSPVLKHQISAVAIMLSWSELVLLIGRHPALSTNIEMLKTVSFNFLKFLAWYSILIIAFALSFYSLFKDSIVEEENFFEDPGISVFKTVVMLTGEFDTGTIPFVQHPITSHILFVLFVFLIAIVLFNLLNGLAVSDTQAIRSDAELVSVVSRAKLVSYLETTLANPSSIVEALSRCLALTQKPISSINLVPSLPPDHTVRVLPNMGCILTMESSGASAGEKRAVTRKRDPCPVTLLRVYMDPSVVERASQVIINKLDRQAIRVAKEEKRERERLLREELERFRHCLNNLTEMYQENKQLLENISKALSLKI